MDKTNRRIPKRFENHPIFNELVCGTNFGFLNKRGYYNTENAKKQPALMHQMGVNWTTLNINLCQEKVFSRKLFLDFEYSVTDSEIIEMTRLLHENGVRVILKPCLTSLDGASMYLVDFPPEEGCRHIEGVRTDYWKEWFTSYTQSMRYFADLAERAGIDALMIGAECLGTEGQDKHWEALIDEVRARYNGPITYEFTFVSRKRWHLEWIKKLDFLAYSYYPPASVPSKLITALGCPDACERPTPTVEEMKEYLRPRRARIQSIMERFDNMPIVFTEIGIRSAHGCSMCPTNYLWDVPYDGEEQANYMQAIFETFIDLPGWMGLFWWKWDETQKRPQYHGDPNGDRGFTIQGKPAEKIMRKWSAEINHINQEGAK